MSKNENIEALNLHDFCDEALYVPPVPTQKQKWRDVIAPGCVGLLGFCALSFWWPNVSFFAKIGLFYCCPVIYPVVYMLLQGVDQPKLHSLPRLKIAKTIVAMHCFFIAGTAYLGRKYFVGNEALFVCLGIVVEFIFMALVFQFYRPSKVDHSMGN